MREELGVQNVLILLKLLVPSAYYAFDSYLSLFYEITKFDRVLSMCPVPSIYFFGFFCRPNGVLLQAAIMLWILLLVVEAMTLLAPAHTAFAGM